MFHRLQLVIAGVSALALAGTAQAQTATGQIELGSTVTRACGLGTPDVTEINLFDLTGPNGLLDPAKTNNDVLGTTTIANAWCNGPHTLTMQAYPMALERTVPYGQPAYMARKVTYDATLVGWPLDLSNRPLGGGDLASVGVHHAQAASGPGLRLNISNLETLTAAGAEQSGLMLEHGSYRGTVTITLAAN